MPPICGKTGMEPIIDRVSRAYCDRRTKITVYATHPGAERAPRISIEMNHLNRRMHTGIGTTRTGGDHRVACDCGDGPVDVILGSTTMRLTLPTLEDRTVILQAKCDSTQSIHQHKINNGTTQSRSPALKGF